MLRSVLAAVIAPIAALATPTGLAAQTPPPAPAAPLAARLGVPTLEAFDVALPEATALPESFAVRVRIDGVDRELRLDRRSTRLDADFRVLVADGAATREVPAPAARTYRGRALDGDDLTVAASLEADGLWAMVLRGDRPAWTVQPARAVDAGAPRARHVGFATPRLSASACGLVAGDARSVPPGQPLAASSVHDVDVCEIAFDCDHDLYQFLGASVPATVAAVERTLDAVNLMYEQQVALTHAITAIVVRTAEPDPYSGNDAGQLLNPQFRDEWRLNQANVRRDVAHFMTSRPMGNILGLAYVGTVCSRDWGYGLNQLRDNHGTNASVLGHELGHNWNLPHCNDPSDIMCGGGIGGGFGPVNRAEIASFRASRDCLEPDLPEIVAHWRLDETAGPTAVDSGPGGFDGTWNGGTPGVPGAAPGSGLAASFDGVDDRIRIPAAAGLGAAAPTFTVAMWVRPSAPSNWQRYLSNATWSLGQTGERVALLVNGVRTFVGTATAPAGRWTHVAAAFVPDRGVEIFVDGASVFVSGQTGTPRAMGGDWLIGASASDTERFAGAIDDVQVYRGALHVGEVAWLRAHPGQRLETPGWSSYGNGLAGSARVPTLGVSGRLRVGATFTLDVRGSSDAFISQIATIVGFAPASLPLLGGTIHVDLQGAVVESRLIGPVVTSYPFPIPADRTLAGLRIHAQAVVLDPGAVRGVAMSNGVAIVVGG